MKMHPAQKLLALAISLAHSSAPRAAAPALAQYPGWAKSGDLTIITTPEGADIKAGTALEGFPLLVRLQGDWFDFKQAKAGGEDVRFATSAGAALAFQIDEWDAARSTASIWVLVPKIEGNARQTIRMHWGKADAKSESHAKAVFNESNGYASVWHLGDTVVDEVGTLESKDTGTTAVRGMIGQARYVVAGKGINCGQLLLHTQAYDTIYPIRLREKKNAARRGGATHCTTPALRSRNVTV